MRFVRKLWGALGKPERATLCEWPGAHQKPAMDFLAATFREKPLAHWMQWLDALDICYGPVNTLPEAIADPNLLKRGAVVTAEDGRKHFAPVVRFKDEPSGCSLAEACRMRLVQFSVRRKCHCVPGMESGAGPVRARLDGGTGGASRSPGGGIPDGQFGGNQGRHQRDGPAGGRTARPQ